MRFPYFTIFLVACGHTNPTDAPDAAPLVVDAPTSTACGTGGNGHVVLDGAFTLVAYDAGPITVSDKIAGVAGSTGSAQVFSFTLRDFFHGDLASVGVYDIGAVNLKYLQWPLGEASTCTPGDCHGFFAASGTYTVTAIAPRYQATFTLGDLHVHDDTTDTMGPAIAGSITGCIDVRPTP